MQAARVFSRFRSQEFDFQKTIGNKGFSEVSLVARLSLRFGRSTSVTQTRYAKYAPRMDSSTPMDLENLDSNALYALGNRLYDERNFEQEVRVWRQLCKLDPKDLLAKSNLASALFNCEELDESLEVFDEVLRVNPTISRALHNRAMLLLRIGCPGEILHADLLVALVTSENRDIYTRHFFNMCMALTTSHRNTRADLLKSFKLITEDPPLLPDREINKDELKQPLIAILQGFTEIFHFFDTLAEKKWGKAKSHLDSACARLEALEEPDHAKAIAAYYRRFFSILDYSIAALQKLGSKGSSLALDRSVLDSALGHLRTYSESTIETSTFDLASVFGNLFFLFEIVLHQTEYDQTIGEKTQAVRNHLDQLLDGRFASLGRMINSLADFATIQVEEFNSYLENVPPSTNREPAREAAWLKMKLLISGQQLNFENIGSDVTRNILGWASDEFTKLKEDITGFAYFVERQAAKDLYQDKTPQENIGRALLQAYLKNRSYREVPIGSGRSDLLLLLESGRALIETKIWRGQTYFDQGIRETYEYFTRENSDGKLLHVFYVVFDPTTSFASRTGFGEKSKEIQYETMKIHLILIHINQPYPSKS